MCVLRPALLFAQYLPINWCWVTGHYAQTLPYSDPEAEAIYRQVQAARSLLLGPDHWLTLWSGHNVAHTLANQGRYSEAIPVLLGIIEAMERTGRENDALTARGTLARAYCDGGRRGEALECQLQVCEQIDRTKHPDHPRAIENKGLLVAIYTEVGQLDRAFELAEDLLPRQRRVFGESHASTLMMQMQMTNLLMKQRKYPEAEALARRTHDLYHATRGPEHANTISAAGWAAHFAMLNGRVEDAERALAAVVVRAERVTTAFSRLNMLSFFASHGLALTRCGRHQEGVAMLRDTHAEQVANPEQGPDHPSSLRTARSLGEALVGAGEVHEGKALLEETLAAQTRVLGPNVYDTEETATQLAKAEAALAGSPAV